MSVISKSLLKKCSSFIVEGQGNFVPTDKFKPGKTEGVKILKLGDNFRRHFLGFCQIQDLNETELSIYQIQKEFEQRSLVEFIGEASAITVSQFWAVLRTMSENGCRKELKAISQNNHANIFLVKDGYDMARLVYGYYSAFGWILSCPPSSPGKDDWIKYRMVIAKSSKQSNSS